MGDLTRRQALALGGKALGAAVGVGLLPSLAGCSSSSSKQTSTGAASTSAASTSAVAQTAAGSAAAQGGGSAGPVSTLKFAYQPGFAYGLYYIAQKKGWLDAAGVKLDPMTLFTNGTVQIDAVINGNFDATVQGFVPILTRAAAGLPVKIVDVVDNSGSTYVIVGKKSIGNVEGLKGKTVGVNRASNYDYFLTQALQKYDMKESDLKIVNFPDPAGAQSAFLAGQLDAIVPITTNTNAILRQRSDAAVLFKAADFTASPNPSTTPFAIYDLVTTTSGVLQKNGGTLAELSNVFHAKVYDYITNPTTQPAAVDDLYAWQRDVVKATVTKDDILASIKNVEFFDQTRASQIVAGGELVSSLKTISDFLVTSGVLKQAPDVSSVVDPSLFKAS